ncbi:Pkinase-fungal domain-containing protein [Mycena indigotica]|uniref:Pkinase-fungal domain-containing protein n=1 Tax=Mycena indigotica TaxID=2126181 RepID=A0A8H6TC65_9AGAR|nr:Pkinase-fungal domain-containing protein [Mycena indigotica]KAF7316100.1 Pkinase-fungal domain-containing protein [Mycena indigotica]
MQALEAYESRTAAERQSFFDALPSRPVPRSEALTVSLKADESQLLELNPDEIPSRTRSLQTPVVTEVHGSLTTEQISAKRKEDEAYCRKHFDNHVASSSLAVILTKLGGTAFLNKFNTLTDSASRTLQLEDLTPKRGKGLKDRVLEGFKAESKNNQSATSSGTRPREIYINNRYWLSALARIALPEPLRSQSEVMEFVPGPGDYLPPQRGYEKQRKYDAALRPSAADSMTIFNVLVNIEYTSFDPPSYTHNPLIGTSVEIGKYQQAITNAVDLLSMQGTRLYIPTLSFHGKGEKAKLFVSILNQDRPACTCTRGFF